MGGVLENGQATLGQVIGEPDGGFCGHEGIVAAMQHPGREVDRPNLCPEISLRQQTQPLGRGAAVALIEGCEAGRQGQGHGLATHIPQSLQGDEAPKRARGLRGKALAKPLHQVRPKAVGPIVGGDETGGGPH